MTESSFTTWSKEFVEVRFLPKQKLGNKGATFLDISKGWRLCP